MNILTSGSSSLLYLLLSQKLCQIMYIFVLVNYHPHHNLYFSDCIKNISLAVKTIETDYFQNHKGSLMVPLHMCGKT